MSRVLPALQSLFLQAIALLLASNTGSQGSLGYKKVQRFKRDQAVLSSKPNTWGRVLKNQSEGLFSSGSPLQLLLNNPCESSGQLISSTTFATTSLGLCQGKWWKKSNLTNGPEVCTCQDSPWTHSLLCSQGILLMSNHSKRVFGYNTFQTIRGIVSTGLCSQSPCIFRC